MDSLDEFDIRDSFDAMDEDKLGRISLQTFYTMYLGLGYPQTTMDDLQRQIVAIQGDDSTGSSVSLETVLVLLSKHPRKRETEMSKAFSLVDKGEKGFISVQDIELLAQQGGSHLTKDKAEAILAQSSSGGRIFKSEFRALFSPPTAAGSHLPEGEI